MDWHVPIGVFTPRRACAAKGLITVDPRISEGNGTEPPLDTQNLRICKNMNINEYHYYTAIALLVCRYF